MLLRAALVTGHPRRAAALAAEVTARNPLHEPARLLRSRALAAGGDRAGALESLDRLRTDLADELGVDPSPEAIALHRRLVGGAATTAPAPPAAPFTDREAELERLGELGRGPRAALVAGRSGSGKSRLLAEFAARARGPVLASRALLPERDTPWSVARSLLRDALVVVGNTADLLAPRAAAVLAEVLGEGPGSSPALDPQSSRALLVETTARVLVAAGTALLVVDDLQWADASSLDAIALAAARAEDLVLLLAFRPEELALHPEVLEFLGRQRAATPPVEVSLGGLDAAALERLVHDPELATTLAASTDGTPFAVLEVIRELERNGDLRRDSSGGWRPTRQQHPDLLGRARSAARAGQVRAISVQVARLRPAPRELLETLALLGRPAPVRQLAAMSGAAPDAVATALDVLSEAELVGHDGAGFGTAHDLVGSTVRHGPRPCRLDRAARDRPRRGGPAPRGDRPGAGRRARGRGRACAPPRRRR